MKKIVLSSVLLSTVLILATAIAVLYASGYRLTRENGKAFVEGTGVIVLTSIPTGANVYINDHLEKITDDNINLKPGEYEVRIEKEGYFTWKKKITVKEGEVSQANAALFPSTPKLDPLTTTGASNVVVDPGNSLIAYTTDNLTTRKNGIYVINMGARPILPLGGLSTQLTDNAVANFANAHLTFSPDNEALVASISATFGNALYLINTNDFNEAPQDVTNTFPQIEAEWDTLEETKRQQQLRTLPAKLRPFAQTHFSNMMFGPENDKILYTASGSATLAQIRKPLKGVNSTPEVRELVDGNIYVYDIKEDRNYSLWKKEGENLPPKYIWHPSSRHLVYSHDGTINIVEFDGQNNTTVYAGPYSEDFVTIWPDGSNLVILTNLNIPGSPLNLYKISLR